MVTVPPVALMVTAFPLLSAAVWFVSVTDDDVFRVPEAI